MRRTGDDGERDPAAKEEVASAAMILQGVVKAARGFTLYLPNNPLHEKFFEELRLKVDAHLEEHGPLRLQIEHDTIRCLGETVYTNPELRENLAFRMYADGLRAITFDEGLAPAELHAFVEIVGVPGSEDDEDDIATRLWGAELPHLFYALAEIPSAGGAENLGLAAPPKAQEGAIRRFATELAAAAPPPLPPIPQRVFSLTEEELAGLQQRVAEEAIRSPIEDVVEILAAILVAESDTGLYTELLGIVGKLSGDLVLTGRVNQAVSLLAMLNRVATAPSLPQGHAAAVERVRAGVVTSEVAEGLTKALAREDAVDRADLRAIVLQLGRGAIAPFCSILGNVAGKETRKVLVEALAETGRSAPALFLPFLDDERWYLVRNTVYILRRIASPETGAAVRRCAAHRDARVRKEVLHFFDEVADPAGEAVMLRLLEDETASLRIAAARSLGRRRSRSGAERLQALAARPAFESRERAEREAVWEALAEIAPERTLPVLREMILKRRLFGQAKEIEETACAAAALKRLGSPEAVRILQEAAAAKRGEALRIVEAALRVAGRAAASRGPQPGEGEPRA